MNIENLGFSCLIVIAKCRVPRPLMVMGYDPYDGMT